MAVAIRRARAAALGCALLAAAAPAWGADGAPGTAPEPRGAVVVALGEGASAAARPLAHDVYRDEVLRPSIDEATARVLCGDAPATDAPQALRDLGELRRSIAPGGSDAASRRLLGSLGADVRARLVVSVAVVDGKPVARVLRVAGAAFEWVTLSVAVTPPAASGEATYAWPGAVAALRGLSPAAPPAPLAPVAAPAIGPKGAVAPDAAPVATSKPFWKSAWFWAPLGVLVAAGVAVIVVSQTTDTASSSLHLQGRVAP